MRIQTVDEVSREMSGAEIVVQALIDLGVDTLFGYPGGAVLPIYDALFEHPNIRHILVRHEQGAVHAAEGYARSTGKPGVVLVTSGPGATNAVTGITDALLDSIPVVILTGQVATNLIGTDAFQECDTVGITRHCTKHNYLVTDPARLGPVVHEAFHIATRGRPGPVVIDIPKNVQVAPARYRAPKDDARSRAKSDKHQRYRPPFAPDSAAIETAVRWLSEAERPIFYTGGGVINAGPQASAMLRELAALTGAPVTSTLMGLGAFPASSPQWLGMLGMHGTYEANMAMNRCDLMLCLGARFDDRVTGRIDAFSPESRKIHVDIDKSSFNKTISVDLTIAGDAAATIKALVAEWKSQRDKAGKPNDKTEPDTSRDSARHERLGEWWRRIEGWRKILCLEFPQETHRHAEIMPQTAIRRLFAATRECSPIISTEVGQHQMWAAQHFGFDEPNKWLTSGGLGTMGYGLPAAIGAQIAHPNSLVIDIAGEASIQMNIQELATASQYHLPVKVFILNNEYMGMVRQWQELTYESRYSNSYSESLPNFAALAAAYGWRGIRIERLDELDGAIATMLAHDGPVMVDCRVSKLANCLPMIPSGAAHTEMLLQTTSIPKSMDDAAKALV